jgi:hypothetical protein
VESTSIGTASVGIVAFDGLPSSTLHEGLNNFLSQWREGSDPSISWMLVLHREVRKTRPMNVEAPILLF